MSLQEKIVLGVGGGCSGTDNRKKEGLEFLCIMSAQVFIFIDRYMDLREKVHEAICGKPPFLNPLCTNGFFRLV